MSIQASGLRRPDRAARAAPARTGAAFAVRTAGCVALGLALAACGTTRPARYFALLPLAAAAGPAAGPVAGASAGGSVGVELVRIPELVDRPQMVTALSEHERSFDDYARWAEPLAPHITGVLAENLAALLAPAPVLAQPGRVAATPAVLVRVEILHFDALAAGDAVLAARWSMTRPGAEPFAEATGHWRTPAAKGDPEQLAAAMSRNLLELSRALAEALASQATR